MKQLSKERLEEIRDYDTCVTLKESEAMARALLAGMAQEPILQVDWGDGWQDVDESDFARYSNARGISSREVYAAPQTQGVPDAWIPCSERMPNASEDVLVSTEFFAPGDWRVKVGHVRSDGCGWRVYGASWIPSHWQPLPAPPKEV